MIYIFNSKQVGLNKTSLAIYLCFHFPFWDPQLQIISSAFNKVSVNSCDNVSGECSLDVNGVTHGSAEAPDEELKKKKKKKSSKDGARHAAQPPAVGPRRIDTSAAFMDGTARFLPTTPALTLRSAEPRPARESGGARLSAWILLIPACCCWAFTEESLLDRKKRAWWHKRRWMAFLPGFISQPDSVFWLFLYLLHLTGDPVGKHRAPFRCFVSPPCLCHSRVGRDFSFFFFLFFPFLFGGVHNGIHGGSVFPSSMCIDVTENVKEIRWVEMLSGWLFVFIVGCFH